MQKFKVKDSKFVIKEGKFVTTSTVAASILKKVQFAAVFVATMLIFYYSLKPLPESVAIAVIPLSLHLVIYSIYGFLLQLALDNKEKIAEEVFAVAVCAGVIVSLSTETLQLFVLTRNASVFDLIENVVGVVFGASFVSLREGLHILNTKFKNKGVLQYGS